MGWACVGSVGGVSGEGWGDRVVLCRSCRVIRWGRLVRSLECQDGKFKCDVVDS